MTKIKIFIILLLLTTKTTFAGCHIIDTSTQNIDPIQLLLSKASVCPTNVFGFRQELIHAGLKLEPAMIANRGYHNPAQGSFSLFEIVSGQISNDMTVADGDFFFGHFIVAAKNGRLVLDQTPDKNALMIEAFAWDKQKSVYNFYELRGDGKQGQWYYRGDSADIMADNTNLHRQADPTHPVFGDRLRCSACHSAGGPIMKELTSPHNDWWEPVRKLDFGTHVPDATLASILDTLVPASKLTDSVVKGIQKMESSPFKNARKHTSSLQETLRPLFCPVELNLMSDMVPNDSQNSKINIPSEFFVDKHFIPDDIKTISISEACYKKTLIKYNSHFPETALRDADHAWLTPVKAYSDEVAIDNLIKQKIIDEKFVYDVLSVDMTNPVVSSARCGLLKLIPNDAPPASDWIVAFKQQLAKSTNPAAQQLLLNMSDANKTKRYYQDKAAAFLKEYQARLQSRSQLDKLYQVLIQRRAEIMQSEISKNPRGQILEPGFRVIFPEAN